MRTKRAWSRNEKTLFLVPVLVIVIALGFWRWERFLLVIRMDKVSGIREVAFSPDGKRVAVLHEVTGPGTTTNDVAIFDAHTGRAVTRLTNLDSKYFLGRFVWSPDSARIATVMGPVQGSESISVVKGKIVSSHPHKVTLWDSYSGLSIRTFPMVAANEFSAPELAWTRGGELWNVGQPPTRFDAETGKRSTFAPPIKFLSQLKRHYFNVDYTLIAFEEKTGFTIREVASGRVLRTIPRPRGATGIWIPPNADVLATNFASKVTKGGFISEQTQFSDLRTGKVLAGPATTRASSITFASKARMAFLDTIRRPGLNKVDGLQSTESSRLVMWDFSTSRVLWQIPLKPHRAPEDEFEELSELSASPDGRRLTALIRTIAADAENPYSKKVSSARVVWDAETGEEIWRVNLKVNSLVMDGDKVQWSADGRSIVIYPTSEGIQIYHLPD